jgi:hypothetical protein
MLNVIRAVKFAVVVATATFALLGAPCRRTRRLEQSMPNSSRQDLLSAPEVERAP